MVHKDGNSYFLDDDYMNDRVLAGIAGWPLKVTLISLEKAGVEGLYFIVIIENKATIYRFTLEDLGNGALEPSLVKTYQH